MICRSQTEKYLGEMYPTRFKIKDTTDSNTSASYFDLLFSLERDGKLRAFIYDMRDDFNFYISNFLFCWVASSYLRLPLAFLSHKSPDTSGIASLMNVLFCRCDFPISSRTGMYQETFEVVSDDVLWSIWGSYQVFNMKPPSPKCYITFWTMTTCNDTLNWSDIPPICDSVTELDLNHYRLWLMTQLLEVSTEHLQWVRHANRGGLILRTPGPVSLWNWHGF